MKNLDNFKFTDEFEKELESSYKRMDNLYLNIVDNKLDVDTFIKEHKGINYCEAIIYRDGSIAYVRPSHIETLIRETRLTHKEIYDEMPSCEHSLYWLLDKTGCVAVWYNTYAAPRNKKLTLAQKITLKKLSNTDIVSF